MSGKAETKPRRGDWWLIEYLPAGYVYVDPCPEDPAETRPHYELTRVVRAARDGGRIEYARGRDADWLG